MNKKKIYIRKKFNGFLNVKQLQNLYNKHPDVFNKYVTDCYDKYQDYYNDIIKPFLKNISTPKLKRPQYSPKNPVNLGKVY